VKAEQDFYREKWQKRIEREKGHLSSLLEVDTTSFE
jgi:hypothetical protein